MKKKIVLFICILLLVVGFAGCTKSNQNDLVKKVLNEYKEILEAAPPIYGEHEELLEASFDYEQNQEMFGKHYDEFALIDINQDEIPELITLSVINFRWTPISIYTFVDGKVILLKSSLDKMVHGTFENRSTANGAYLTYVCEDGHIHNAWRGTNPIGEQVEVNNAYVVDGKILKLIDCDIKEDEKTTYFSDILKPNTVDNLNKSFV